MEDRGVPSGFEAVQRGGAVPGQVYPGPGEVYRLAIRAFLRLEWHRLRTGLRWYKAKKGIIWEAIKPYLANPLFTLTPTA